MWSGSTIPSGWALCDGRVVNGRTTPDLRGRFIIGVNTTNITVPVGQSSATITTSQPTYNLNTVGGLASTTVPSHTHNFDGFVKTRLELFSDSQCSVLGLASGPINGPPSAGQLAANNGRLISGAGGDGSRYRLETSPPVTGGGQTIENRPPYYALAFIMRVN
jgi:microcystin-dependent protein